jgi:hypothetical protein
MLPLGASSHSGEVLLRGSISQGRACHSVPTAIGTCSITAMVVYTFERVPMEVGT